jgi:DNA-binding transcriptional MerR regulator/effector-binding domain-containing protein
MFSIGEFSSASGIPVRTLRYYHEEGLLVPAAVDVQTGYRSYNMHNLEVARVIVHLRSFEFSLDDIRTILADCREDEDVLAHLERQKASLHERLRHYRNLVNSIDRLIIAQSAEREEYNMIAATNAIQVRDVPPLLVGGIRMTGCYGDCGKGFAMLGKRLGRYVSGKPLCLFYDGEYRDCDANFEPCMPIRKPVSMEGIDVHELPACRCVVFVHQGPYDELSRSYALALRQAKERGYEISLPTREVYLKGPGMFFWGNPKKYLTEIQLPIVA